jgi:integrase
VASTGRIYKRGEIYFIAYSFGGREYRESTRSRDPADARRLLDARLAELVPLSWSHPAFEMLRFDDLARGYVEDYELRQLRTLKTARARVEHLRPFFGQMDAAAIRAGHIRAYQRRRRDEGATAATTNRETASLHRMFRLAVLTGRLAAVPPFPPRLRENPPRQGFFEHAEYVRVRAHLPAPYQDVLDFAYYSGWRRREITELTWQEVDVTGGVIRLDPARSKTGAGRVLPLSGPLRAVLTRRLAHQHADDPHVFRREGVTVRTWKTAWAKACALAGLTGKHLHDCRRTAARNLVRAGVPERIAMTLLGHLTRSIFDRYNIVSERDLIDAAQRLTEYIGTHHTSDRSA